MIPIIANFKIHVLFLLATIIIIKSDKDILASCSKLDNLVKISIFQIHRHSSDDFLTNCKSELSDYYVQKFTSSSLVPRFTFTFHRDSYRQTATFSARGSEI